MFRLDGHVTLAFCFCSARFCLALGPHATLQKYADTRLPKWSVEAGYMSAVATDSGAARRNRMETRTWQDTGILGEVVLLNGRCKMGARKTIQMLCNLKWGLQAITQSETSACQSINAQSLTFDRKTLSPPHSYHSPFHDL